MIERWLITGDTHGSIERFINLPYEADERTKTAIIILGDAGFNYYGYDIKRQKCIPHKSDLQLKEEAQQLGYTFYCVHGNHEFRPEHLPDVVCEFDEAVNGKVYYELKYPNIRYFTMWGAYQINDWKVAVIGGAYSIDKEYRLSRKWQWFDDEQLTTEERQACARELGKEPYFDIILTHTCPTSWQPTDLFLSAIDQSQVDNSTEEFLEDMRYILNYNLWLFGHYHQDRYMRPGIEMLFEEVRDFNQLIIDWYNPKWKIPDGKILDPMFHSY